MILHVSFLPQIIDEDGCFIVQYKKTETLMGEG